MQTELSGYTHQSELVFLLCHGHIGNREDKRYIGQTEYPLSHIGNQQSQYWQQAFQDIALSTIFTSDLQRTCETAQIVRANRRIPIKRVPELREIALGEWENKTFGEVQKLYPREFQERGNHMANFRPPGGESFSDLQERVWAAFSTILNSQEGNILIVGHSGVNRVILGQILGLSLDHVFRFRQDYGGLNILVRSSGQYTVQALNILPGCNHDVSQGISRTINGLND